MLVFQQALANVKPDLQSLYRMAFTTRYKVSEEGRVLTSYIPMHYLLCIHPLQKY